MQACKLSKSTQQTADNLGRSQVQPGPASAHACKLSISRVSSPWWSAQRLHGSAPAEARPDASLQSCSLPCRIVSPLTGSPRGKPPLLGEAHRLASLQTCAGSQAGHPSILHPVHLRKLASPLGCPAGPPLDPGGTCKLASSGKLALPVSDQPKRASASLHCRAPSQACKLCPTHHGKYPPQRTAIGPPLASQGAAPAKHKLASSRKMEPAVALSDGARGGQPPALLRFLKSQSAQGPNTRPRHHVQALRTSKHRPSHLERWRATGDSSGVAEPRKLSTLQACAYALYSAAPLASHS